MSRQSLTQAEHEAHERLLDCERELENSLESGYRALRLIHDQKLYKADGYSSFKDYCEKRWGWSKSHAHRLIDYSKVVDRLRKEGQEFIPSEGQIRPALSLRRSSKDEEDFINRAANAVRIAIDTAPKKEDTPQITRAHTQSAMAQFGVSGRRAAPKVDPAIEELKSLFRKFRHTKLYELGDSEAFIKKYGMDGFPDDFTDMVDLLNECAALLVR